MAGNNLDGRDRSHWVSGPPKHASLPGGVHRCFSVCFGLGVIAFAVYAALCHPGVPERVAMIVTGHKTRAVFDRYHIVSPGDLQDVARRLTGTIPGTIDSEAVAARLTPAP